MPRLDEVKARERALNRSYYPRLYLQGADFARGTGIQADGRTGGAASGLGPNIQNARVQQYIGLQQPVISVDTKKKELVGDFKNSGQDWSPRGKPVPAAFAAMLRPLFRSDWVVYAKRPFGGAEHVLRYLGCYTHRVAISNHRLVALEDEEVVFRWRDSAHHNKKRLTRLALDEFLRRFFLHVLPKGFVRIRHFGIFAHRRRAALLPICFALLAKPEAAQTVIGATPAHAPRPLWRCPRCGGPMAIVERFTAAEARLRAPPADRAPL